MIHLKRIIKLFDIYGNHFNLRINNQSKFKSEVGGLLSVITMAILVFCIISFGKSFYSRDNPNIVQEDGLYLNKDIPQLNGTEYYENYFTIRYDNSYDNQILPSITYLDINGKHTSYLNKCSQEFIKNNSILVKEQDYKFYNFYCIRLNNYNIGGKVSGNFYPLIINFNNCADIDNNDIEKYNLTCDKNSTKIENFSINLFYYKVGFNPRLPNPFVKKLNVEIINLKKGNEYTISIPLSLYKLIDDLGWIVESYKESQDFSVQMYSIFSSPITANYPRISFALFIADSYKIYNRSYIKLQELFASIGGFMKLVFTLLNFLNYFVRSYLMDSFIINQHFCVRDENLKNESNSNVVIQNSQNSNNKLNNNFLEKLNENKAECQKISSKTVKNTQMGNNSKINTITSNKKQEKVVSNTTKKAPNVGIFIYLNAIFQLILGIKNKSNSLTSKRLDDIKHKLLICDKLSDFTYISLKLKEIDTLKSLLLNDYQSLCFRYLQKPIEVNSAEGQIKFSFLLNTEEENISLISDYFIKLLNEEPLSGYDEILFGQLDNKIKTKIVEALANK